MVIKNSIPPLTSEEKEGIIETAISEGSKRDRNIAADFREWIDVSEGLINVSNYLKESLTVSKQDRHAVTLEAKRLCERGLIEKYGLDRGVYRKIDNGAEPIAWEDCDETIINVQWPFELQKFYLCLPKNIVVIAGSPDAGKTAFCLNFAMLNMDHHPIKYFTSEMGALELKTRIRKFNFPLKRWGAVKFIERSVNFSDVIDPNGINIVDYIEVPEEAWKIATPINEIFRKLNKGICVIALQKPRSRDIARGGESTLDRPRLYLSMGNNQLKIIKCKNWARDDTNPNGLSIEYKLFHGCVFTSQSEWGIPFDSQF